MTSLGGTVYDSLAGAPLASATVQAVRADGAPIAFSTHSDAAGRFRFDSLAPGRYLLGFLHPRLDVLGLEVQPLAVDLSATARATVALAVPGPLGVHAAVCPARSAGDSTGAIAGSVRDADSDTPAPDATVVFTWSEIVVARSGLHTERRRVPVAVRPDGSFLVCGVPGDDVLEANATAPGRTSGLVEVVSPGRGLAVQQFTLGPALAGGARLTTDAPGTTVPTSALPTPAAGTARVVGRIVSASDGRPVRGARVRVWGTGETTETGDAGTFALGALPSGTFTLEARAIGLAPTRVVVDLARDRVAEVRVALPAAVRELDRVVVRGRESRASRDLDGFLARRETGRGVYVTQADIARRRPIEVTDLLRATSGLWTSATGVRGNVLRGPGGCIPPVFLDGVYLHGGADDIDSLLRPQDVAAIEVYRNGSEVPVQFGRTFQRAEAGSPLTRSAGCGGAVVIWTRR